MNHQLKCWPEFMTALLNGSKTFEVRHDDRGYSVGDTLTLQEYDPNEDAYGDRTGTWKVTYLARGGSCPGLEAIPENVVVMGVKRLYAYKAPAVKDSGDT